MKIEELMGRVIDSLYSGLTGGSAELPLPDNTLLHFLNPGMAFHESAFDFALAGPFAGPTPQTLPEFAKLVEMLMGGGQPDGGGAAGGGGQPLDRATAIEQAKLLYQQNLLGGWEQWSRLVDFIPLARPTADSARWSTRREGKFNHVGVVYAQAGQTLSRVYKDTLDRCWVADEELTAEEVKLIERMRALLGGVVETEDFLGQKQTVWQDSPAMTAYTAKKIAYENAVLDYASRLAMANTGTAADLITWQRSGGIYRRRAIEALRDWEATGNRSAIERAQATISHITGSSMVAWKDNLDQIVTEIEDNTTGVYGYPFHPASLIPGSFARSAGWSHFHEMNMQQTTSSSTSSRGGQAGLAFSMGIFSIGGGGAGSQSHSDFEFKSNKFGMDFDYTTVEIVRPAFNPNFFLSRGWKPKDSFIRDYKAQHSDGKNPPDGAMIGYPTKALFIRNLTIHSTDIVQLMHQEEDRLDAGGTLHVGPFVLGGSYQQANRSTETNYKIDDASITVNGLQLVAFLSALFPYTANPSPDIKKWI
jgi:uncharacterized membrane protein YgcG